MDAKRDRIGKILVKKGLLSRKSLTEALKEQERDGRRLGEILVEKAVLGEEALRWALAEQLDLPLVQPDPAALDPEALALIPPELCRRYGVLPLHLTYEGPGTPGVLTVAVADPSLKPALDDLAERVGRPLRIAAALREDIDAALGAVYGPAPAGDVEIRSGDIPLQRLDRVLQDPTGTALLRELLETAVKRTEEVLHFRARDGECFVVDSRGQRVFSGGETWHTILLDRLRQLAGIPLPGSRGASRILQKGRFAFPAEELARSVLFRVSLLRGVEGEEAQVRLMSREGEPKSLTDLGLTPRQRLEVGQALSRPGLVWVTSSGDGGLASTLFGLLREIPGEGKTFTIEEEVFYRSPDFLQLETLDLGREGTSEILRELKYLDFPRVMLDRASPAQLGDLLALAVRKRWVLAGAPEASLQETLLSLAARSVDVPLYGLSLVIHQRLSALLCPKCRVEAALGTFERQAVARLLPAKGALYQEGPGCSSCEGRGTAGFRAFYELLPVDAAVREALYGQAKGERRVPELLDRVQPSIGSQVAAAVAKGKVSVSELWDFV
ncbi:MAG: hypothetical protein HGA98_04045 [Deltaproteobacteria bacterium]|nr:hypothetical protein [Deltaproteobacteria bacterium]